MEEQQYIKGFNSGYLLAKHDPDMAKQLAANPNDQNPYFQGLMGGKQEYEKEVREWAKGYSRQPARDEKDLHNER